MKQQVLYLMKDAKLLRDESKEAFASDLYNVINLLFGGSSAGCLIFVFLEVNLIEVKLKVKK